MTPQFKLFAVIGFVLTTPVLLSAQNSDQQPSPAVVRATEAAFPQDLRYAGEPPSENPYDTCAVVFNRNADGTPDTIAAAYSGDGAEIAMLAYTSSGATIISSITNQQFWLTDGPCDLQLVDLADPQHPDSSLAKSIDVTFKDGADWFLTWKGNNLQNITALQTRHNYIWKGKEVPNSDMYQADVVDIDHRGPMQIVGNNGDSDKFPDDDGIAATPTFTLFRYNGISFAPAKTLLTFREFKPNIPKTAEDLLGFNSASLDVIKRHQTPAPNNRLEIVNGDRDGSNRVMSAKIEVNGVPIILSSDINQSVETLVRTIQLQKENDIRVTVDGPAKSHLYLTVE